MSGMNRYGFTTIQNSGALEGFSVQCMLISILHYLRYIRQDQTITLTRLREIGGLGPDTAHTMFDIDDPRFVQAINRICNHFNIQVNVHYANRDGSASNRWLGNPAATFGRSSEIVPVVAFGLHFELIVSSAITGDLPITTEAIERAGGVYIHNYTPVIIEPMITSTLVKPADVSSTPVKPANVSSTPVKPADVSSTPVKSVFDASVKSASQKSNQHIIDELVSEMIEQKQTIQFIKKEIESDKNFIKEHYNQIKNIKHILESEPINEEIGKLLYTSIETLQQEIANRKQICRDKIALVDQMDSHIYEIIGQIEMLKK